MNVIGIKELQTKLDQAIADGLRLAPSLQQQVRDVLEQTSQAQ